MNWEKLLCKKRERESTAEIDNPCYNEFDKDYSRIVYSSSVRRLQDKAQVFPLQENDFTRTRLTHSIEVASLGRSLAWNIGNWLFEEKEFESFWQIKEFVSITETACLVHDLGNPPFGHYGEDIIRKWFKEWFQSNEFKMLTEKKQDTNSDDFCLTEIQKKDFLFFEGNAQGLRILSKLQILNDRHGANFTYGTLASLIKYPWYSSNSKKVKENNHKFGCFQSEKELFEVIKKNTGIGDNKRHPSTLLMEAADDIAYLPTDLEDAVKKGAVSWDSISKEILKKIEINHPNEYKKLLTRLEEVKKNEVPEIELINMQLLKITIQGILIKEVIQTFKKNYSQIMEGKFDGKLISKSEAKYLEKVCKELCFKYVFSNKEVITLELVGDKVLTEILSLFVHAVVKIDDTKKSKTKEEKLYHLISENFRYAKLLDKDKPNGLEFKNLSLYDRLQLVTDFVSGMTDSYAVSLHQQLLGVKMP